MRLDKKLQERLIRACNWLGWFPQEPVQHLTYDDYRRIMTIYHQCREG